MDGLPVELVETIVELADFRDVCALRLCNRGLYAKVSQGSFRTFIPTSKRLCLNMLSLRTLVAVTGRHGLARGLQRLTLVGVHHVDDPPDEAEEAESEHAKLLTKAFCNIGTYGDLKKLTALSLEVIVRCEGKDFETTDAIGWYHKIMPDRIVESGYPKERALDDHATWETSSRTFQVAMEAVSSSALVLDDLQVRTEQLDCNLACDLIARAAGVSSPWPLFRQTRRLALNVSHYFCPLPGRSSHNDPGD